jgi:hypothetical protein
MHEGTPVIFFAGQEFAVFGVNVAFAFQKAFGVKFFQTNFTACK